ncbi:MAG: ArsR/SmtB family transcription factor [Devosia sp.]
MTIAPAATPTLPPSGPTTPEPDSALVTGLVALADPTRLRILAALRAGHESCRNIEGYVGIHVSDLARQLGMTQPAVSQHLARLRQAGLVNVTRKGQFAYYQRDETALQRLHAAMTGV